MRHIKEEMKQMKLLKQGYYTGERVLYHEEDLMIEDATFDAGESPLKECRNIEIKNSIFKWKYPLWYCHRIRIDESTILDTARSGIWYTEDIQIRQSIIEAPKTFRRSKQIDLKQVYLPNADETLWNCEDITLEQVSAKGNYFGMNAQNVKITDFQLDGNYAFDGGKHIEIHRAKMLSKDSFWNCEDVTIYDSLIIGEYLGWNSKNITLINCTIDSLQGMCYMENLKLVNCKLLNTNLTFEFSTVDAVVTSKIDSVKNPISGHIVAKEIGEIILDERWIDSQKTKIEVEE